jgi:aminoglycoside 6'-N-acetyltransferase
MTSIHLRPASLEDVALLEAWDDEPVIAASDPNDDWDWPQTLAAVGLENLVAELNGRPIGFIQITDLLTDASQYWGPPTAGQKAIDIWIGETDQRGQGHGRAMMALALQRCFADPTIKSVLIDPVESNTDAIAFYQRLGFAFVEKRTFGSDICAVHQITRAAWHSHFPTSITHKQN